MTAPSMMAVQVQRPGQPNTRSTLLVALEYNLAHLRAHGWEFPRFNGAETFFGSVYALDATQEAT